MEYPVTKVCVELTCVPWHAIIRSVRQLFLVQLDQYLPITILVDIRLLTLASGLVPH